MSPASLAEVLSGLRSAMRPGPLGPELIRWWRGAADELAEQDRSRLTRWLDRYDPALVRQPPVLRDLYWTSGRWLTAGVEQDDTPHDLVAWGQLEIAAIDAEVTRLSLLSYPTGFDINGIDVEPRMRVLCTRRDNWSAILRSLGESDAL